jgi:hypothetical protein
VQSDRSKSREDTATHLLRHLVISRHVFSPIEAWSAADPRHGVRFKAILRQDNEYRWFTKIQTKSFFKRVHAR